MALVLVVDDDADVLEALCTSLEAMGHRVERAGSGLRALTVLDQAQNIDLLLTDVVMPGLHGFNLARMAVLRRPDLRVLYFTGNADMEVVQRDEGPKYGKMLHKPLGPDDLRREIEEALSAPRRS
jgi:CheY-like chemotaxis protein